MQTVKFLLETLLIVLAVNGLPVENLASETLLCDCTPGATEFCDEDTRLCNADSVAEFYRERLRKTKDMMRILWEFPGDLPRQQMRNDFCAQLSQNRNITADFFLLDFMDWVPSCARTFSLDTQDEVFFCSMGPSKRSSQEDLTLDEINQKISKLFKYLKCPADHSIPTLEENVDFCDTTQCNSKFETTSTQLPQIQLPQLPEIETAARITEEKHETFDITETKNLLLYIVLPCVIGAILLLAVLAFVAYKFSLWSYVYTVNGKGNISSVTTSTTNSDA
jgi:hypothetical protein